MAMEMLTRNFLFAGLFAFFICSCYSYMENLRPLGGGYRDRFYAVPQEDYLIVEEENLEDEDTEFFSKPKPLPNLTKEKWMAILGNLQVRNYDLFSARIQPVFYKEELSYLLSRLVQATKRVKAGERLVVVYKSTLHGNLARTTLRNSFVLWNDKNGLNILINEVRRPLISEDLVHQYPSWHLIKQVSVENPLQNLSLNISQPYYKKSLGDREYESWICIALKDIGRLPKPYTSNIEGEETSPTTESKEKKEKTEKNQNNKQEFEISKPGQGKKEITNEKPAPLKKQDETIISKEELIKDLKKNKPKQKKASPKNTLIP